ncbi:hypothetical protein [Actinoplanes palleronii]|uniref:Uncharacterized protein n=1 Tax=Actinoplanes palleronii TaxID=113570 RepID=A0ABQ4BNY2_9ACTN|nr:hypothetical protein [Actinoplanes palleronii]GIE72384.1 hypothetical protein Apa02nite_084920 [Actinoplanes palleronii]
MDADRGLDVGEHLVLQDLEGDPVPPWELGWPEALSRQEVADVLGPGLVSLAARGFIEVRRFPSWPEPWEHGLPVAGDELLAATARIELWSDSARMHLAAQITDAGVPYL